MKFNKKNKTGLIGKDPKDERDYLLGDVQPVGLALPDTYLLKDKQSPVENQFGFGVCYAMSATGIAEFWNSKEYNELIDLSERFVVHYTKVISGIWDKQPDYFRNAVKAICDYGVCLEKDYPADFTLDWTTFSKTEPSPELIKKAEEFKGKTYWRVSVSLENLRQAIYQNQSPVLVGMAWYNNYTPDIDGKLPLPIGTSSGHAIICVGWENNKLWFKNSWGNNWGYQGYFYIPFEDFQKHDIWDIWILLDLPRKDMKFPLKRLKGQNDVWFIGIDGKRNHIINVETFNRGKEIGLWGNTEEIEIVDSLPEPEGSAIILINSD